MLSKRKLAMTAAPNPGKAIPIMPCLDIRQQAAFYQELGFDLLGLYTSPNSYVAVQWNNIELHFYGTRKLVPAQNTTMCFLFVPDVNEVNQAFTFALKSYYGKVPRTGFPKITKVRRLVADSRFTLTDPGGNTFYIGSPNTEADRFFRTLTNPAYAKLFTVLYDLLYSKEDLTRAVNLLSKCSDMAASLQGIDQAKYLLVLADIQKQLGREITVDTTILLADQQADTKNWQRIRQRYHEIRES